MRDASTLVSLYGRATALLRLYCGQMFRSVTDRVNTRRTAIGRLTAASCLIALLASACDSGGSDATADEKSTTTQTIAKASAASYKATGGIRYAYVLDAPPKTDLIAYDAKGKVVGDGTTDRLGSLIVRDLAPGGGYRFQTKATPKFETNTFEVLDENVAPNELMYKQDLKPGINYVKMRDGVELAMTVRLPNGKQLSDGPFPTVLEYSGYAVAAPGNLLDSVLSGGADPLAPPTSTAVGGLVAPLLGYATVSVQMRGSGCSGGDFNLFDLPTTYDGYDAVETVAAQSWVRHNKVGMVGISFSGISQLFVAGTRPPHLAAIAPMSVVHDLYDSPGYPGGIPNSGFAASWIAERERDAQPAPEGGQAYAKALINEGDNHCKDNQKLRLQTQIVADTLGSDQPFRDPAIFDHRATEKWAEKIDVPTFIVGAFQDEQTGGAWTEVITALQKNPKVFATVMNGTHVDSLGPGTIGRWAEFLSLYVADQAPSVPEGALSLAPTLYNLVAKAGGSPIAAIRYGDLSLEAARAEYENDPRVRVFFDNGGGAKDPGSLSPQRELSFDSWPVKSATATTWYFGADGALLESAPTKQDSVAYVGDPKARPADDLVDGEDSWWALPKYEWAPVVDGKGLAFITAPFAKDVTVVGTGSADLYVKSSAKDTDLQVTISEVRPDGSEMLAQSGWMRASHRKQDGRSTPTGPRVSHRESDRADMPVDTFELVRVPIFPFGQTFRAGTRLRISIQAPGGDRQIWSFATLEDGTINNSVGLGGAVASKLVLPVVKSDIDSGAEPPCPSNRAQPCRTYVAAGNGG